MLDLKAYREKKKITQGQLATACGVSKQTIYYIERRERNPSIPLAQRIAKVLGFKWTEFFE